MQAAVFASMHPYDIVGVTEIAISGVTMGLVAWLAHGIEASSALHIVNNMTIFYTVGFGFGKISTVTPPSDLVLSACIDIAYLAIIIICSKRGMFDEVKYDDAAEYNKNIEEKAMLKAYLKDLKQREQTGQVGQAEAVPAQSNEFHGE